MEVVMLMRIAGLVALLGLAVVSCSCGELPLSPSPSPVEVETPTPTPSKGTQWDRVGIVCSDKPLVVVYCVEGEPCRCPPRS